MNMIYQLHYKLSPPAHIDYGSEFRPTIDLKPIRHYHDLWSRIKFIPQTCSIIPLLPLCLQTYHAYVILDLEQGNQKGAIHQPVLLHKLVSKDVSHGFAFPISHQSAMQIKDTKPYRPMDN